jgi:hypothetical protein
VELCHYSSIRLLSKRLGIFYPLGRIAGYLQAKFVRNVSSRQERDGTPQRGAYGEYLYAQLETKLYKEEPKRGYVHPVFRKCKKDTLLDTGCIKHNRDGFCKQKVETKSNVRRILLSCLHLNIATKRTHPTANTTVSSISSTLKMEEAGSSETLVRI